MDWDQDALKAIDKVPFFVRRMAKRKVEEYIGGKGGSRVTLQDVQESRKAFMGEGEEKHPVASGIEEGKPGPIGVSEKFETVKGSISEEHVRRIEELVEKVAGFESRCYGIKACGGSVGCPLTLMDTQKMIENIYRAVESSGLADYMSRKIKGPIFSHHKFKISVAGCPNNCSEPQIKDFGLIARVKLAVTPDDCIDCGECLRVCKEDSVAVTDGIPIVNEALCVGCGDCAVVCPTKALEIEKVGFTILVGGKLGRHPRFGGKLFELADEEAVYKALRACIELQINEGLEGERLGSILQRIGMEKIRQLMLEETLK